MRLLPTNMPEIDRSIISLTNNEIKAIYRLITFSRKHLADDLLDSFLANTENLKELLSIKNAQMEAQDEEEVKAYLKSLKKALVFITKEINENNNFETELQLFQIFRLTSPESHAIHPNRYRNSTVQIGSFICPDPSEVPALVSQLFYNLSEIKDPILKAIYFHHELIRIHPFSDGNGRTTRISKNWMLMYHLYPPIFIRDDKEKEEYILTLNKSFKSLDKEPNSWNKYTINFFKQEINRIYSNTNMIYKKVHKMGYLGEKK